MRLFKSKVAKAHRCNRKTCNDEACTKIREAIQIMDNCLNVQRSSRKSTQKVYKELLSKKHRSR